MKVCLTFLALLAISTPSLASTADTQEPVPLVLLRWMPLILQGFGFNILISISAMSFGTVLGVWLGILQISPQRWVRIPAVGFTQFFRNAPWLVLLFFVMFLVPFEVRIGDRIVAIPDWLKAIFGLSLPVMANVSELVRGAIASLPKTQWEAAESLALTRRETLWSVILPQCIKRVLPPWMNLYAILTMATVLAHIVGVREVMTLATQILAAEGGRTDLLGPIYGVILLLFFMYCYPIGRLTQHLEKRFAVKL